MVFFGWEVGEVGESVGKHCLLLIDFPIFLKKLV